MKSIEHSIEDANNGSERVDLVVDFDIHGLSVTCPEGQIIIIDFSQGKLNVYRFQDEGSEPELLTSIG